MADIPTYTLYWQDTALGTVEQIGTDFPWWQGKYIPVALPAEFSELFRFMTAEENVAQDPPFAPELLADEHWSLRTAAGETIDICLPAVYWDQAEIHWRLR